jgi:hypothetical protein
VRIFICNFAALFFDFVIEKATWRSTYPTVRILNVNSHTTPIKRNLIRIFVKLLLEKKRAGESFFNAVALQVCVVLPKKVTVTKLFSCCLSFLFQLKTSQHPSVQFLGNEGVSCLFYSLSDLLVEG